MPRRFWNLFFAGLMLSVNVVAEPAAPEASPAPERAPAPAGDSRLSKALEDLQQGRWKEARAQAKHFLERNKKNSAAWVLLGRSYLPAGKYARAVARFRKAARCNPLDAAAYYWAGQAYEAWGKTDEALNEYQAALQADPGQADAAAALERLRGGGTPVIQ